MNRVYKLALRRPALNLKTSVKRRENKASLRLKLIKRAGFIAASALCGFALFHFYVVSTHSSVGTVSTANVSATRPNNDPTQNNPLFAAGPSWSQNYTGRKSGLLDPKYWNVLVGPADNSNKEQQYYTTNPTNLHIDNGALHLTATRQKQPAGYQYGSSRIETQNKQTFLYGRMDIEAKLPKGVGTWPAVWLLPANGVYAQKSPKDDIWSYENGGEIDVIEAVGFQPNVVYGVAHTASDISLRSDGTGSNSTINVANSSTHFNKYTLLWTPTSLTFAVNDVAYYTYTRHSGADYTTWPFDQPFYLIANLAMGGSWGGLDTVDYPGNGIDNSALPASLDIRSIYYYPYTGVNSTQVK
jgi:beta-glucanase (GH16 family)